MRSKVRTALFLTILLGLAWASAPFFQTGVQAAPSAQLNCTFTPRYPAVNLRSGPGASYDRVGVLYLGETLKVVDQATGSDGYIWWKGTSTEDGSEVWVRSDLGTSDCPSTCGNSVCESGEDATSCAKDCGSGTTTTTTTSTSGSTSTGTGCVVPDCESCYKSVSCYPQCNECTCTRNSYGCVSCYCRYPSSSGSDSTTSNGCTFPSCEACIAAFPCLGGPCTQTECTLNDYGCPTCSTAP